MHPLEFLYWLLGAITLGKLYSLEPNTEVFDIVFDHIELVKSRENNLQSMIKDGFSKPDCEKVIEFYQFIINLESTLENNSLALSNLELLGYEIKELVLGFDYEKKNQLLYYLQGAFELVEVDKIKISLETIKQFKERNLRFNSELLFYFVLTGVDVIEGVALDNLKAKVDRALWTAC
jgi:hypothetical protein